ncbi:hypothetical protein ACJX0J_005746, partial [Zea mays]
MPYSTISSFQEGPGVSNWGYISVSRYENTADLNRAAAAAMYTHPTELLHDKVVAVLASTDLEDFIIAANTEGLTHIPMGTHVIFPMNLAGRDTMVYFWLGRKLAMARTLIWTDNWLLGCYLSDFAHDLLYVGFLARTVGQEDKPFNHATVRTT